MKTYEVYNPENRNREFIRTLNNKRYHFSSFGCLIDNFGFRVSPSIDEEWVLVPQEVPFAEAMIAYIQKKTIQSLFSGRTYKCDMCTFGHSISHVSVNEIKGMWIIKE